MPTVSEAIAGTTAAVAENPSAAQVVVRTSGHLTGTIETTLRSGRHTVRVDEPAALAGEDSAPGPVDFALIALASCQTITYRFWAEKLGIALDDVEVTVEADLDLRGFFGLDEGVRPGFTAVRVAVTPKGPESAERYQELAAAVDAHCPVLDLFANSTPVEKQLLVAV
jgi:putative redox protein